MQHPISLLQSLRPGRPTSFRRFLLPIALATLMITALTACGRDDADDASDTSASGPENGFVLTSGDLRINATASSSLLRGQTPDPLSVRILGGWVNTAAASSIATETDPDAKQQKARQSFGTMQLAIAAGADKPGSYQLASKVDGEQSAAITIPAEKDLGLDTPYTSTSGTLTLERIHRKGQGPTAQVTEIIGSFKGTFHDDQATPRDFSGTFRYVPEE